MTIESSLTRELEIRFIDARAIATEAKLNLGIDGYPSEYEERAIINESVRIFHQEKSRSEKHAMRILSTRLNSIKSGGSSSVSSSRRGSDTSSVDDSMDFKSVHSNDADLSLGDVSTKSNNKFKLGWPIVRRR